MTLLRKTGFKGIFVSILLIMNILMIFIYSYYLYTNNKALIMKNIDDRLLTTAYGFKFFADPYHDLLEAERFDLKEKTFSQKKDSFSKEEYFKYVKQVLGFYEAVGVEAAYTLVYDEGNFYFTLDTPSPEEFAKGIITPFYYKYKNVSAKLKEAYDNTKINYDDYRDEWGSHRSVFLPTVSSKGKKYIIGVDIKLKYVQSSLKEALIKSIAIGLIFLIVSAWLIYIISSKFSRALNNLCKATGEIAMGNLDLSLPDIALGRELATLTDSFDNMKTSLKNYIKMSG